MEKYTFKKGDIVLTVSTTFKSEDVFKFSDPNNYISVYGAVEVHFNKFYSDICDGDTYNILGSHEGFHLVQFPFQNKEKPLPSNPLIYLAAYDFTKPGPMFLRFMMTFNDGMPTSPSSGSGTDEEHMYDFLNKSQQYFENNPKVVDMLVRPFIINAKDP